MNPQNRKCGRSCNVNGILLNEGICKCLEGFKNVNGFCHNCTAPGQMIDFINLSCKCMTPQFYKANNGSCVKSPCNGVLLYSPDLAKCYCPDGLV